ncbi:unnamed protein product [Caenorhabditis angaria]|uniref:Uncharacterized protein n=1 Tax=Caenorhabditis angaria TaxID=860376 RepID=A0A9P1IMC6_9PELO|nr:unnamed protein product [Caenorhabditis angaria]
MSRFRRDSETSSSDSWSIVEEENNDIVEHDDLMSTDSESDSDSDSDLELDVLSDSDDSEISENEEEEVEENQVEPIIEEPPTDDEEENEDEEQQEDLPLDSDYISTDHSDLEIEETQDEEDEELQIIEIRLKETDSERRNHIYLLVPLLSITYTAAILFLTNQKSDYYETTLNAPPHKEINPLPPFLFTFNNNNFSNMSPLRSSEKLRVVLDGPIPPLSVCMPSKPRNLSVPMRKPRQLPKSYFSKFRTQQSQSQPKFSKFRGELAPRYNLRSLPRKAPTFQVRDYVRDVIFKTNLRSYYPKREISKKINKNLPSVIYNYQNQENTTFWTPRRKIQQNLKKQRMIENKGKSLIVRRSEVQYSRKASQMMRPKRAQKTPQQQCEGRQFSKYTKKRISYKAPLPCRAPQYKPSEQKNIPKPSFDWIQRRAQTRKSLREMY